MLLLKRHLVQLVREGKKRQTIRLWARPMLRAGQVSYTPGLGKMLITSVDILESLSALTEEDAWADGFPSRAALLEEIGRIYGPHPTGRTLFRIRFQWPLEEAARTAAPPQKIKPRHKPLPKTMRPASITEPKKRPAARSTFTMSPAQRQTLRTFILTQAPVGKKSRKPGASNQ